jgi:hypothetical protein
MTQRVAITQAVRPLPDQRVGVGPQRAVVVDAPSLPELRVAPPPAMVTEVTPPPALVMRIATLGQRGLPGAGAEWQTLDW